MASCEEHLLNKKQHLALHNAKWGTYHVQVMQGEINDSKRTVVLLGETHLKNEQDDILGKKVVDEFSIVAHEKVNSLKEFTSGYIYEKMIRGFYALGRIFQEDSTITYAMKNPWIEKNNLIHIEQGHHFTPEEKRKIWALVAEAGFQVTLTAATIGSACMIAAGVPLMIYTDGNDHILSGGLVGFGASMITNTFSWIAHKGFDFYGFQSRVLCESRDKSMSENILNAFSTRQDIKKMLVIVGMNHVEGIRDLLIKKGFTAVDLK